VLDKIGIEYDPEEKHNTSIYNEKTGIYGFVNV
jgi:hypothetical protein